MAGLWICTIIIILILKIHSSVSWQERVQGYTRLSCLCYSGVWRYRKVNARVILEGKGVGVHSFLDVNLQGQCRGTLFLSSIIIMGYTLSYQDYQE